MQPPSANIIVICMRRRKRCRASGSGRLARHAIKNAGCGRRRGGRGGRAGPRRALIGELRAGGAARGARARVASPRPALWLLTTHVASAPHALATRYPRAAASPCERPTALSLCTVNEGSASCTRRRKTTC